MIIKNATATMKEGVGHSPSPSEPNHQQASPYSGSPTLSSSSGISFSFPSEMAEGMEDEDLFWTSRSAETSGNAVFCPSTPMSPVHHRFEAGAYDQYGQDSPTKTGGIPIEVALFSDDEESSMAVGRLSSLNARLERTPTRVKCRTDRQGKSVMSDGRVHTFAASGRSEHAVSTSGFHLFNSLGEN